MTSFDIEDNGIEISVENDQPRANKINKIKKNASSKKSKVAERNTCEELVDNKNVSGEGNAPGVGKVYVKTWGCAHNNSDSEYMAGLVSEYGYTLTDERSDADLWLLNSCTVKSPAEMHFRNFIDEGLKNKKSIVVSGCVAQSDPNSPYLKGISIVGVHQIDRVVEVVEETLKGHSVQLLGTKKENGKKKGGARLDLPKIRKNPLVEILAINTGCLNRCTYCKTKHARGDLGSYHPEELVERARVCFMDQGCKELWITSEDTGAYGLDIGSSLPELMWKLIDVTPVDCMIRLGMTNPPYMRRYLEDIAKLLNHKNVYSFLHIPVQSGSDGVLTDMKREYCSEDFCEIVDFLQERVPGLTIATDFICGFPTETDEDFRESLDLLEKYKFPTVFINQFFPRPGTPAAFMRQIPGHQIKKRTAAMSSLFKSYQPYKGREGRVYDILVTDVSFDKKHYIGHNKCYEQILIPMRPDLMGKWVKVKVIATSKFSMHAQIIEERISIWRSLMEKMYQLTSVNNNSMQFMCVLKTASYFCSISIPIFLMYRKGVLKL